MIDVQQSGTTICPLLLSAQLQPTCQETSVSPMLLISV